MTTITLPWPSRMLSSNTRANPFAVAAAVRVARRAAWALCLDAGIKRKKLTNPVLRFTFRPPDNRRRDVHNMPHAMKAYIDGVQDATGINDALFRCDFPMKFADVVKGGRIVIEITDHVEIQMKGTIND